jgi:hypothetical protein
MSLKDLFNVTKVLPPISNEQIAEDVESVQLLDSYTYEKNRIEFAVDYSTASNFAIYGSAKQYYQDAFARIYEQFPYDGSKKEKIDWENSSSLLDIWIYENVYPRTTGYATFSPNGWSARIGSLVSGYGEPTTKEYISIKGGPNTNSGNTLIEKFKDASNQSPKSNVLNLAVQRGNNLEFNLSGGVSTEFWLKKQSFINSSTSKEVIFDLWNNETSSSATYGRLTLELSGTTTGSPFYLTILSGTTGFSSLNIGSNITTASVANNAWNHYAVVAQNSGSTINVKFYVNGELNQTIASGINIGEVTGSMLANIGALRTAVSGTATDIGWGKLSGSIDEFRYWKTARTSKDIGRYWWTNIHGGANTDEANTDLGVYYKFNEGITLTSSVDSIVLDYSGRITNGAWTGYTTNSRNTGSAIDSYAVELSPEERDPIIYSTHPDVVSALTLYTTLGEDHDYINPNSLYRSFPDWMVNTDTGELLKLTQIVSSYLDSLYLQIKNFTNIKEHYSNVQIDEKPFPFSKMLGESLGLITPDIFIDATLFEQVMSRDEDRTYEDKLNEVKNIIYENIYSNLQGIYKSKGTEKSFRNLLRCFGIDESIVKMNIYANNDSKIVRDDLTNISLKKKSLNFNDPDRFGSTIYQFSTSSYGASNSYILGSSSYDYLPLTFEIDTIFPKKIKKTQNNFFPTTFLTSSIFGVHSAVSTSTDLTWAANDYFNFQVFAVRPEYESEHATFYLSSSNPSIPVLSSSYNLYVYDNEKWNFAVRFLPTALGNADLVGGTTSGSYTLEFYGVSTIGDTIIREFSSSAVIPYASGSNMARANKRVYVGAERTNFTGSLVKESDIKVLDLKVWSSYLDNEEIKSHARDSDNYGSKLAGRSYYLTDGNLNNFWIPKLDTLLLHWDFNLVTGSDGGSGVLNVSDGKFIVNDLTSGSLTYDRYGSVFNNIKKYDYIGRGDYFLQNDNTITDTQYLFSSRINEFENIQNSNLVYVLTTDEQNQTRIRDTRPINYFFSFEKSMYRTISDEMLKMFSTIVNFNNLVGDPVNKYRKEYKDLRYLRTLFFQEVQNEPELDKYLDFYKWIDSSLGKLLLQLVPASAETSHGLLNVVENHAFTRNKHQYKFPTLEFTDPVLEAGMNTINIHLYNWKFGHRPISNLEDENCLYWNAKAERNVAPISSSVSSVNTTRQQILSVTLQALNRSFTTAQRYKVDFSDEYKGGPNFHKNKKIDFMKIATAPHGPMDADDVINVPANYLFIGVENTSSVIKDCNDIYNPSKKVKYSFDVVHGRDYLSSSLGYGEVLKSDLAIPANFVSGNVTTGYNAEVVDRFMSGVIITNLHNDSYGDQKEIPAQGPFTNQWMGGLQSRHIELNQGTDDYTTRPEGWKLLIGQLGTSSYQATLGFVGADYPYPEGNPDEPSYPVRVHKRATYYRDFTAKSPYNIKNIGSTRPAVLARPSSPPTGTLSIGNFYHRYEYFHTFGKTNNNKLLVDNATSSLSQTELFGILRTDIVDGRVNFTLPTQLRSETIIGNKFSSPGDYRTMSRGYLNLYAEELSPYNVQPFKNRKIIGDGRRVNPVLTNDSILYIPEIISGSNKELNPLTAIPSFAGYQSGSTTIASLHKVPRNGGWQTQYSGTSVVTTQKYDNGFYRYEIPKTDAQYSWIKYSVSSTNKDLLEYQGHLPESLPTGSISYVPILTLLTQSLVGVSGASNLYGLENPTIPVDFAHMNTIINDVVITGSNTLGTTTETNYITDFATINIARIPRILNGVNLNRNGPYGYSSFKQVRAKNKIITALDKNAKFSFVDSRGKLNNYEEPSVYFNETLKYQLLNTYDSSSYEIETTFRNNLQKYESPRIKNKIVVPSSGLSSYSLLLTNLFINPNLRLLDLTYEVQIYPQFEFSTINRLRRRTTYTFDTWRDSRANRQDTSVIDPATSRTIPTQSAWPLDSRIDLSTPYLSNSSGGDGVLQNAYSSIHNGVTSSITASVLYSFKHMLGSNNSWASPSVKTGYDSSTQYLNTTNGLFDGTAKWQVPETSEYNKPYYDSYNDWFGMIKYKGKNYQIMPEYRISNTDRNMVLAVNNLLLEDEQLNTMVLPGSPADPPDRPQEFKVTYFESNTIELAEQVMTDMSSITKTASLTLICDAIVKLNPEDSFYPVNRTLDLAEYFYKTIVTSSLFWTSSAIPENEYTNTNVATRNFMTPMFAPGIMYNTIKSGIAVDFPVLTSSILVTSSYVDATASASGAIDYKINNPTFDARLPFETLYDPDSYLKRKSIIDLYPHPSASLNITGSWTGTSYTELYKYAIHNFLSEIVDFYLPEGKLTSLISKPEINFQIVQPNKQYRALIKLYKSKASPVLNVETPGPLVTNYTRPQFLPKERESILMYNRASAFGPPVNGGLVSGSVSDIDSSNGYYSPFTPPYYDGEAWVLLTYNPTGSVPYRPSLDEIINNITASYLRYEFNSGTLSDDSAPLAYGKLNLNSMQASASLNLFNVINIDQTTLNNISNNSTTVEGSKVWAIQTKFETPILDYASTITIDSGSQANETAGVWHQLGSIIEGVGRTADGIFLQVTDIPNDYILYGAEADEKRAEPTGRSLAATGSLADVVGFSKEPVRLGQLAKSKNIKEAVVAIPYLLEETGGTPLRVFFSYNTTNKNYVSFLKSPASATTTFADDALVPESIKRQISLMQEYVIPPGMDFMKNDGVVPFSMYIFEFEYNLTQQDLANIWQGIMPSISYNFAEQSKSITHELTFDDSELLDANEITDKIRWLVFKVKKKAKNNYNNKLFQSLKTNSFVNTINKIQSIGRPDTDRFAGTEELDFSFNWPYDNFSLVEMAKINAKLKFFSTPVGIRADIGDIPVLDANNLSNASNSNIPDLSSTAFANAAELRERIRNIEIADQIGIPSVSVTTDAITTPIFVEDLSSADTGSASERIIEPPVKTTLR